MSIVIQPPLAASLAGAAATAPPATPAVVAADAALTYAELFARANALADHLRSLGTEPGALVGVCLPRSAALVVADVAVLQAGAAYVALDPSLPAERLRALVADSGAALVITGSDAFGAPDDHGVVRVADTATVHEPGLAYVIHTSGSTGTPKGVLVEQAGVLNLAAWHGRAFRVGVGTRTSQLAGVGFDAAAWETWGALCNGATLVVPPEDVKTDPGALRDWLVAERVEVAFAPTPLAESLVRLRWPASSLRFLLTGGDRLHAAPPVGLPFVLVNDYGVTEASVVSTSGVVAPGQDGLPTIGAPIDGVHVRIADESGADAEEGELLIGGVSVARGYLGSPALTAERFVEADGVRWYRTGDRVRWQGGEIAFAGRSDDQLQVRGFRVEPAEVEAALVRAGADAAAVGLVDDRLVAWVEGTPHVDHLPAWLPAYMVPSVVVPVDRLPMTPNGKVDRAALALPSVEVAAVDDDDLVGAIGAVLAELLGVPAVGPDESFLLLGGHSLLGAQLVIRIGERYGVELGLRDLFDDPTPAGIAGKVEQLLVEQILAEETA